MWEHATSTVFSLGRDVCAHVWRDMCVHTSSCSAISGLRPIKEQYHRILPNTYIALHLQPHPLFSVPAHRPACPLMKTHMHIPSPTQQDQNQSVHRADHSQDTCLTAAVNKKNSRRQHNRTQQQLAHKYVAIQSTPALQWTAPLARHQAQHVVPVAVKAARCRAALLQPSP